MSITVPTICACMYRPTITLFWVVLGLELIHIKAMSRCISNVYRNVYKVYSFLFRWISLNFTNSINHKTSKYFVHVDLRQSHLAYMKTLGSTICITLQIVECVNTVSCHKVFYVFVTLFISSTILL